MIQYSIILYIIIACFCLAIIFATNRIWEKKIKLLAGIRYSFSIWIFLILFFIVFLIIQSKYYLSNLVERIDECQRIELSYMVMHEPEEMPKIVLKKNIIIKNKQTIRKISELFQKANFKRNIDMTAIDTAKKVELIVVDLEGDQKIIVMDDRGGITDIPGTYYNFYHNNDLYSEIIKIAQDASVHTNSGHD